jgi:hypothetical protein
MLLTAGTAAALTGRMPILLMARMPMLLMAKLPSPRDRASTVLHLFAPRVLTAPAFSTIIVVIRLPCGAVLIRRM